VKQFFGRRFFKAFPYILPCKSLSLCGGAICDPRDFILTNLNLLALRMVHAKYQCIPVVHEKKIFEYKIFPYFVPY